MDDDEFSKAFDQQILEGAAEGGGDGSAGGAGAAGEGDQAAAAAGGDGAGAAGGDASGTAAGAGGDQGAGAGDGSGQAAEGASSGAAPAEGAAEAEAGGEGDAGGEGGAGGDGAGGDARDPAAAADGGTDNKAGAQTPPVQGGGANAEDILNRLAAAVAAQPKAEAPAAEAPAEEAPIFNEAETQALAKFRDDWPEEAKAIDLMQRQLGASVIQHVFDQVAPVVKEIRDTVQALAIRAHTEALTEAIGEYPSDEEIDNIADWVKTQPKYLQDPMLSVIKNGTPEEISDLVGRYREATGAKKPAGEQAPQPKPQGGETELSGAAKQAAEALAPVGSKRTAVQNPDDSSDFDAAFDRYKLEV